MGMYDNVTFKGNCPSCGAENTDWQSKDGPLALCTLDPVDVNYFYTSCKECGKWINAETERQLVSVKLSIEEEKDETKDAKTTQD